MNEAPYTGPRDANGNPVNPPNQSTKPVPVSGDPNPPQVQKNPANQPPQPQRAYPSLPGLPISDEEHAFLKASRERREKKWEELRKLAAEIGATVSGYPGPGSPPHIPNKYVNRGERPSGLTLDQEVENERYYDDTERNTLHREQEIKDTAAAEARLVDLKRREVDRGKAR